MPRGEPFCYVQRVALGSERCPSGLRSTLGKRVLGKLNRGFESHPLRHNLNYCSKTHAKHAYFKYSEFTSSAIVAPGLGPTKPKSSTDTVPMPTALEKRLRNYIANHYRDNLDRLVFTNQRGRPYSANKLRARLHVLLKKLGIPHGGPATVSTVG